MKNEYKIIGDKTIIYTKHKGEVFECVIDTIDLEKVKSIKNTWFASKPGTSKTLYASTQSTINGKLKTQYMHRLIIGDVPKGLCVDHINRDTLNNSRSNLRVVTDAQNKQNRSVISSSKTNIRGVHYDKDRKKWRATASVNGKQVKIGRYNTIEEAENAVIAFRKEHLPYSYESEGVIN